MRKLFQNLGSYTSVLICGLFLLPSVVQAYGFVPQDRVQERCFARAMVGMDSVINSRLGVPAEHALELSVYLPTKNDDVRRYDEDLLNVILSAYLWKESPHSYAVNVFYNCASESRFQQQAKSD